MRLLNNIFTYFSQRNSGCGILFKESKDWFYTLGIINAVFTLIMMLPIATGRFVLTDNSAVDIFLYISVYLFVSIPLAAEWIGNYILITEEEIICYTKFIYKVSLAKADVKKCEFGYIDKKVNWIPTFRIVINKGFKCDINANCYTINDLNEICQLLKVPLIKGKSFSKDK